MICGIFHGGSGLGNQLHRYVATRVLALDKGYEWGMCNPELFKGSSFMNIDMGIWLHSLENNLLKNSFKHVFFEKKILEDDVDIRCYDPEINFIEDGTIIDGEFQDERYFEHRLDEIKEWLKVEPLDMPDDLCVIGFRGGEYALFPELFLTREYWEQAIEMIKKINPKMRFEVHTDDEETAIKFFPEFKCTHDIGLNWRSIRYAKYLIIANSSFYIFPSLLGDAKKIIAPRYWARRNIEKWALPQNYYKRFSYL